MVVSIINIGDELLIGQVVNSNASVMSRLLVAAGMDVKEVVTISDEGDAIKNELDRTLRMSDAVLITGGLGPTKDDITKHTLCEYFGSRLVENEEALANVKRIFDARGFELTEINRQQAWVPECCEMLNNDVGTAPCMWFEREGKVVVSMPGVPYEMEWLMTHRVVEKLKKYFKIGAIVNKNILVQGIGESFLSDKIESWELALPKCIRLAYLPQAGLVKLRLTARGEDALQLQELIDDQLQGLYALAGEYIVGEDMESLPELVAKVMTEHGLTMATAESCTGGTIASRLTALAGASAYFKGGVVAYSNEVKERVLGVKKETLECCGAVSEACVKEMARGVKKLMGVDMAVATSGVAGPSGGTPEKPVGTVWMALAYGDEVVAKKLQYGNLRQATIDRTCNEAYASMIRMINNK